MGNLSSRPVEQSAAVNVPLQSGKRKQPASPLAHPRDAAVRPASSAAARRSLPSNQSSRPSKYARSKWKRSASLGRAVDPTSHPDATLKIIGYFGGAGVVVKRSEWITELVYCGGYGKGIFSRSIPSFVSQQEQQQRQHRSSPSSSRSANSASVPEMPFHYKNEALYSLPSPQLLNGFVEPLQLGFEEAYYLAFELGCLCITPVEELAAEVNNPQQLSAQEAWSLFCRHKPSFPDVYVAFVYYRSRGWVAKSGLKYAADLVLYQASARQVHAQFAVCVRAEEQLFDDAHSHECCGHHTSGIPLEAGPELATRRETGREQTQLDHRQQTRQPHPEQPVLLRDPDREHRVSACPAAKAASAESALLAPSRGSATTSSETNLSFGEHMERIMETAVLDAGLSVLECEGDLLLSEEQGQLLAVDRPTPSPPPVDSSPGMILGRKQTHSPAVSSVSFAENWSDFQMHNRVAEQAIKGLVYCFVLWPRDQPKSASTAKRACIQEIQMTRWAQND